MKNTPTFWYPDQGTTPLSAIMLWPLSLLWRAGARLRALTTPPYHPDTPTIVIGNITAGGTGKTPYVAALAQAARASGRKPVILTRGYGGSLSGPHPVTENDDATRVGDEACLLARYAPVVVARHRGNGAAWIEKNIPECDLIIMDDGLQNPGIVPHCTVAVFNGRLGIGNGMVIPSGPLRETLSSLSRYDAVVITGNDEAGISTRIMGLPHHIPVFNAARHLNQKDLNGIKGKPVMAFAGIGDPDSFFKMLKAQGISVEQTCIFPDHHPFTDTDIAGLKSKAVKHNAVLVTTEKDMMRLSPEQSEGIQSIGLTTTIDRSFMDILPKAKV